MESVQRSAKSNDVDLKETKEEQIKKAEPLIDIQKSHPPLDPGPTYKYSAEANIEEVDGYKRVKRGSPSSNRGNRKTCHLYIQTDPLFWRHINKQVRIKGIRK